MKKKIIKKDFPKIGDTRPFKLPNPYRKEKINATGIVKENIDRYGGTVKFEKGSVIDDEIIVRLENVQ